jgi:putative endonuclease
MPQHLELGRKGEDAAANYLVKNGFSIRDKNWKTKYGEIDIIAETPEFLVIVEVKTRSSAAFGNPEDAVDLRKQRLLVNMADFYIRKFDINKETRFDVLSVIMNAGGTSITHYPFAFSPFD